MKHRLALLAALTFSSAAQSQLGEFNQAGVRYGHIHMLVRDVDAHKRFFTQMLGAKLVKNGSLELLEFPGIYVVLTQADDPKHPSTGNVDHFGFMVKDFATHMAKWKAANMEIEPLENPNEVYLLTPDKVRVEVYGQPAIPEEIAVTHIHYYVTDVPAVRAWYVDVFGANPNRRPCVACISSPRMHPTVDVGFVNLTVVPATTPREHATRGYAFDHVGFDVKDIDAFVTTIQARGIKLDAPIQQLPGSDIKSVFLTDPWGTRIEITEGLGPREPR